MWSLLVFTVKLQILDASIVLFVSYQQPIYSATYVNTSEIGPAVQTAFCECLRWTQGNPVWNNGHFDVRSTLKHNRYICTDYNKEWDYCA